MSDYGLLQGILNKVLLYRFTRNLDKELQDRKISHAELSVGTGRIGNWFNRTFNELEDMRISTFIKSITAINQIIDNNSKFKPLEIHSLFDHEMFKIASVIINLSKNDFQYLLNNDPELHEFLNDIKFYVESLKALNNALTKEEIEAYERILHQINIKRTESSG